MSAAEGRKALAAIGSVPRDDDGPVFPAPWAARAFALAIALNERGVFAWPEWSELLGAKIASAPGDDAADPETYWRAWLAALEDMLLRKDIALTQDLLSLKEAWREAAEHTPHGEPIELGRQA